MPRVRDDYNGATREQVLDTIRRYGPKAACDKYGITRGQAAGLNWKDKHDVHQAHRAEVEARYPQIPTIEEPPALEGDWLVVSDVQLPTTDYEFAERVGRVAERHCKDCQGLAVVGDFLNADAFSVYSPLQALPTWQDELNAGRTLIAEWLKTFKRIVITLGNHEARFFKALGGIMAARDLLALLTTDPRVTISIRDCATVDTDNGPWTLVHGSQYSRNQLWNPDRLAHKFQTHIVAGHEHHLAIGFDLHKRYVVIANGGLFDVSKMAYVQLRTSTMPGMARGFTMLRDGYATLYGDDTFTDWASVLPRLYASATPAPRSARQAAR